MCAQDVDMHSSDADAKELGAGGKPAWSVLNGTFLNRETMHSRIQPAITSTMSHQSSDPTD